MFILKGLELIIVHRSVGSAKIDGPLRHLFNTATGSDGLVIDLKVRVFLVILVKPLRVHRERESSSRAIDEESALRPCHTRNHEDCQDKSSDSLHACSPQPRFVIGLEWKCDW